jgi:hypothetical protein
MTTPLIFIRNSMTNFLFLGGKFRTREQAIKWRQEENYKNAIFCDWCIAKNVRHMKDCPTLLPDFDPNTPKLTLAEREELKKQRELNKELINK